MPVLSLFWALRLWRLNLVAQYPLLMVFLVGGAVLEVLGFFVYRLAGPRSDLYVWYWPASRVISSTLFFLVLLQVYQRLVDRYEGFRKLGRVTLHVTLGIASAIILASIVLGPSTNWQSLSGFWIVEERGVYLALTAMVVLLLGFAVIFRLIPTRNVLVLFGVFGLFFAGQASLWVFRDFWGWDFRAVRLVGSSGLYFCCLLSGTIAFSRSGEQEGYLAQTTLPGGGNGSGGSSRLEEINEALLNVFRL